MSRQSKNEYYLSIAQAVSQRSTCLRRKYGVVIVKDDEIIATGYNGSPRGEPNCCDTGECKRIDCKHNDGNYADCPAVHAEMNAIISASRAEMMGTTLYLAGSNIDWSWEIPYQYRPENPEPYRIENPEPCPICARLIKNAGIKEVVS